MRSALGSTRALAVAGCALLVACFSANKPLDSTQTGNPPVIDTQRVGLHVRSDSVHVVGEPGAVEPGGVIVEVTNLDSGAVTRTKAASDGSFDVAVDGSPYAVFSVRARDGGDVSSTVYVLRGTAAVGDGQGGALSCEQRNSLAGSLIEQITTSADRYCNRDADCTAMPRVASCYASCDYAFVSRAGAVEIKEAISDIDEGMGLCSRYASDGCEHPKPSCEPAPAALCLMNVCQSAAPSGPPEGPPSCQQLQLQAGQAFSFAVDAADTSCSSDRDCELVATRVTCRDACEYATPMARAGREAFEAAVAAINDDQCRSFERDACTAPPTTSCRTIDYTDITCSKGTCLRKSQAKPSDCVTCLDTSLEWGDTGGLAAVQIKSRLEPCADYSRTKLSLSDGSVLGYCGGELIACNAVWSTGAVMSALADSDVQAALAQSPVLFGTDRTVGDGQNFQFTVGMRQVQVGGACTPSWPNCKEPPSGVQALVTLLKQIDQFEDTDACAMFAR
ncbi:MAG TPA: hypothetical protein VJR89_28880 [Polyangiales bacterium]|nr:hypothetical protein [Polyangiales bacterium]